MPVETSRRRVRTLAWLTIFASLLFALIGVRFLMVPDSAARSFGLAPALAHELHYVVGLRDLWLAILALAFALLREWRALMFWFALGSLVCFADSLIVQTSSANPWAVGFHVGSGIFCLALAWVAARAGAGHN